MTEIALDSHSKQSPPGGTCRACMLIDDSSRMIFLFERNNNLAEIFSKCTSLVTTDLDDGLPKHICLNCHNDLVNYNKFRLLCTASDTHFRSQNVKVKCEDVNEEKDVNSISGVGEIVANEDHPQSDLEENCEMNEDVKDVPLPEEIPEISNPTSPESDLEENCDMKEDVKDALLSEEIPEISNPTSPGVDGADTNKTPESEVDNDNLDKDDESGNKKATLTCDKCGKKFFKLHRLEGHLRQHQGLKPCVCKICGKCFSKWSGLSVHMNGWHNDKPDKKQFPCDAENCDKTYNMKQSLRLHKKNSHSDSTNAPEIKFVCEMCGKQFATSNSLKKHTYTHTGYENMPYSCSICPKKYTTKHKLKEHMMRHNGVKNHICPICGLRKTTPHELKVHINYHTKEKLYPCKLCKAEFSSIGNMSRHFKIVHCGIKKYTCTICDRSFGKSETLKHHVFTHTGEKPHACSICDKRFIQSVALQTHMKTHKKVT